MCIYNTDRFQHAGVTVNFHSPPPPNFNPWECCISHSTRSDTKVSSLLNTRVTTEHQLKISNMHKNIRQTVSFLIFLYVSIFQYSRWHQQIQQLYIVLVIRLHIKVVNIYYPNKLFLWKQKHKSLLNVELVQVGVSIFRGALREALIYTIPVRV